MLILGEDEVRAYLSWRPLIEALRDVFRIGCDVPLRTAHSVPVPGEAAASLLLMPAWQPGRSIAVKMVNVVPGNASRGLPAVSASVIVFDGVTGRPTALLDGGEVTARRTAAASALAADYLARADAGRLLIVGAGRIAANLAEAHPQVRPIETIRIWARSAEQAGALARRSKHLAASVEAATDLEGEAGRADVISCATLATQPLIRGEWLRRGAHLDLVGGYRPDMREADDAALKRADAIVVDTYEGALAEAGDLTQPLRSGAIERSAIVAELRELCAGVAPGRRSADDLTVFKSVGTALEDYAAATLALRWAAKTPVSESAV
jgi:ornithine cyclodeaminase